MANRSKMLPLAAGLGILLVFPIFFMDWNKEAEYSQYPQLEEAERIVRKMSSPHQLRRSTFLMVYPEGKPSQFVNWIFSPFGAAHWPPSQMEMEDMGVDLRTSGITPLPEGVGIYSSPRPEASKHILVKADDKQGLIVVEGYLKSGGPPVFVRQWSFNASQSS